MQFRVPGLAEAAALTLVERRMQVSASKRQSTIHVMHFVEPRTLCGRYVDYIEGWHAMPATAEITCARCKAAEKVRLRP